MECSYLSVVWSGRLIPAPPRVSFRRLRQVPLHVQCQVVWACEWALADGAFKWLCPRVLAVVTRQLVRPRESPLALRPLTRVRLLTWEHRTGHCHWCPARTHPTYTMTLHYIYLRHILMATTFWPLTSGCCSGTINTTAFTRLWCRSDVVLCVLSRQALVIPSHLQLARPNSSDTALDCISSM